MTRFIDLADTFTFHDLSGDVPGYMIARGREDGTIRKAARAHFAMHQATTPWATVILRKCFGVAGAGHGNYDR